MPQEPWQPANPAYPAQPPVSPPPQMPPTPYQPPIAPTITPVAPELAPKYIKPHHHWLRVLLAILLLTLVGGGSGWLYNYYRTNPDLVFNRALSGSLSTKQVQAATDSSTVLYDVSNPKDPRISTLTTKILGADTYAKGYGTLQNTFIDYASNPNAKSDTPTNLLDQWIQVRDNGTLPDGASVNALASMSDPRLQLLAPWMFGNFSGKDRGALQTLAKQSGIYKYQPKAIARNVNGAHTYTYTLTIDGTKLAAYESKAGELFGIPAGDITAETGALNGTTVTAKITIDTHNSRVTQVQSTLNGISTTVKYSNYNKLKLPAQPNAALTYADYLNRLGQ
ncbi:MAG TPA: hypothetical protein VLG11_00720 [Candidatus Saccharimonadales bacterium]|nr:hypothetical protein [Candidatus Saccharimonadales bacterium]